MGWTSESVHFSQTDPEVHPTTPPTYSFTSPKSMAVATVDEYLAALEKSQLLDGEQLAQAEALAGRLSNAPDLARALARENFLSRWQAGTLLALGKRARLRLGKYRLIQRLGKGGMGTVFLAEHVTMHRRVALKIVPRSIAKDRASLDRFFAEARAIAALDHPNIVQAYSVDNEMDRYFIVMEYIEGQDLQRMVETNGPLEFDRAADFLRQAAEGLAHAHARNLVHCDVKPSNLLVNGQGVIKILDLGLARLNQSDDGPEPAVPALGTVDYMAPEQALDTADFDNRADIYSLGCTLYFLLTGHPPFPEGTLAQRIIKHQTQAPRDVLAERPGTPSPLAELCRRMMAKRPQERCQSMQEVIAAIAPQTARSTDAAATVSRAVKLIDEPAVSGQADDWLTALVDEASASAVSDSTITSAGNSGRRLRNAAAASGGFAESVAARLAWFNTTPRKLLGAICVSGALAAVAALAAVPLLFSPLSDTRATLQARATGDRKPHEGEAVPVADTLSDAKPASSAHMQVGEPAPKTQLATANPPAVDSKAANSGPTKPIVKPQPVMPTKSTANPPATVAAKPASPGKKPNPPTRSADAAAPKEIVRKVALDGLLPAVDVPPPKELAAAVSLGTLAGRPRSGSAARSDLDIQILGGETIAKGNPRFTLHKESDAAAWSIVMAERNKVDSPIARLVIADGQCTFQWTAAAKDRASLATLVRFCGLKFSSGGRAQVTLLTAPKHVPPLLIDLDNVIYPSRHLSREIDLPDPSLLRLQVLPLDPSMPKHEIKVVDSGRPARWTRGRLPETNAGDTIAPRGRALVVLAKESWPQVTLEFEFNVRGRSALIESLQATYSASPGPLPFNAVDIAARARLAAFVVANEGGGGRGARKASFKEVIQDAKSVANECKALEDLLRKLRREVTIPFRVFVVAGPANDKLAPKVVIFEGNQAERVTPAGPKRTNKGKGSKD